ncbi:MAG: LapA family protein [Zoogloeaceae bacterium]|nr:LapA family protein [Zoogloeaceae bacterium]
MTAKSLLIGLALTLVGAFALLNWSAFTAPTTLYLGFAEVQAPLGLVMLVITGALCALFLVYIVLQQAGVILEARRYAKELKAHRELADKAEASRFTELRAYIETELNKAETRQTTQAQDLAARLDRLEQATLARMDESTRSLSAYVGEVEDKIDRALPPPQ